jgi:hypothetical protein
METKFNREHTVHHHVAATFGEQHFLFLDKQGEINGTYLVAERERCISPYDPWWGVTTHLHLFVLLLF